MTPLIRHIFAATLLLLVAAGGGRTQEERAVHYRLKVRIDPAAHRLEAEAWVQNPPASRFYLHRDMSVREVTAEGRTVPFRVEASGTTLPYAPEAVAVVADCAGAHSLHVRYGGEVREVVSGVNLIARDLVELALYSAWYPVFQDLKKYTFDIEADLPDGYVTTTNGVPKTRRTADGRVSTVWTSGAPAFDIVLIASPHFHRAASQARGIQVEVYYDRLSPHLVKPKMEALAAAMTRLTSLYGPPRIKGVLRLVYSPRAGWGYSRLPLIVVSEERALEVLSQENGEAMDFRGNCHELAHFWWMVADPSTPDDWINEGLAEFSAFRLTEERFGNTYAKSRIAEYRHNASQSKTSSSIAETETSSPDREINRYDKTTLMLLEAKHRFGKEPLDKLLRAIHARFAGTDQATTNLFLEEAEKQMGKEAQEFFRQALFHESSVNRGGASASRPSP